MSKKTEKQFGIDVQVIEETIGDIFDLDDIEVDPEQIKEVKKRLKEEKNQKAEPSS